MTIENTNVSRRTLVKGAAWSLPVVAVAAATPLAAASTVTNVGDFSIDGSCGALGIIGAGFDLTAGNVALPAGTVIDITTTGSGTLTRQVIVIASDAQLHFGLTSSVDASGYPDTLDSVGWVRQ